LRLGSNLGGKKKKERELGAISGEYRRGSGRNVVDCMSLMHEEGNSTDKEKCQRLTGKKACLLQLPEGGLHSKVVKIAGSKPEF